jgi:hypothetical protein
VLTQFLVGDYQHMKHNARENRLRNSGFDTSAMERLSGLAGMAKCVLERNYRSHPSIVIHFSMMFYASVVKAYRLASAFPPLKGIYWPDQSRDD